MPSKHIRSIAMQKFHALIKEKGGRKYVRAFARDVQYAEHTVLAWTCGGSPGRRARALIADRFGIPAFEWDVPATKNNGDGPVTVLPTEVTVMQNGIAATLIAVLTELRNVSATLAAIRADWAPTTPKLNGSTHASGVVPTENGTST